MGAEAAFVVMHFLIIPLRMRADYRRNCFPWPIDSSDSPCGRRFLKPKLTNLRNAGSAQQELSCLLNKHQQIRSPLRCTQQVLSLRAAAGCIAGAVRGVPSEQSAALLGRGETAFQKWHGFGSPDGARGHIKKIGAIRPAICFRIRVGFIA